MKAEEKKIDSESIKYEDLRKKNDDLNQYLRELREEVHDLSDFVGKVKIGQTSVSSAEKYIIKTREDVNALFGYIEKLNQEIRSDTVRHISNLWEQIQVNPIVSDPATTMPQQEQLHALTLLEDRISKMILAIGHRTIPHRLNVWLGAVRPGYFIPFHQLFESELPDHEGREKVLRSIALAPKQLNAGIVIRHSGLVYRYDPNPHTRRLFLFLYVAFFICLSGAIWALGAKSISPFLTSIVESTFNANLDRLFSYWIALLAGIVAHVVVTNNKRIRESGAPAVIAVNDWILLFSARKGDIMLKVFFALFALIATIIAYPDQSMNSATFFFIGYSLDSFIGLFGESMDQKATAQLASMRKKYDLD